MKKGEATESHGNGQFSAETVTKRVGLAAREESTCAESATVQLNPQLR